ncbi:MAG: hypothetical protein ACRD2B_10290 [Terriglobia bacterium]
MPVWGISIEENHVARVAHFRPQGYCVGLVVQDLHSSGSFGAGDNLGAVPGRGGEGGARRMQDHPIRYLERRLRESRERLKRAGGINGG